MVNKSFPESFTLGVKTGYQEKFTSRLLKIAASGVPGINREAVFDLVRRVSRGVLSGLPKVVSEAVLEAICDDFGRFAVVSRLAPGSNVVALRASGKYGIIQSASSDSSVLKHYAKTGTWAERTNSLLQSFFANTGGNYIDIGANIGLTTIPVAQNPRVHCIAVEPEPENFANLCVNVRENCPFNNVEVRRIAIFAQRQRLSFELSSSGNLGDHRLRLDDKKGRLEEEKRTTIDVEAIPLDEIAGNLDTPLAVKIDTQGAEPHVVAGGKGTLARAGLIVSEFWPYGMSRLGGCAEDLIRFLRDNFSTLSIAIKEEGPPFLLARQPKFANSFLLSLRRTPKM